MVIATEYICVRCDQETTHLEEQLQDAIVIKCLVCNLETIESLDDFYDDDFEP